MVLIATGIGNVNLRDLSPWVDATSIEIHSIQGDTVDTLQFDFNDLQTTNPIRVEDDVVVIDEQDSSGWPTVNLLFNPGLEGSYVSNIPPSWSQLGMGTSTGFALSRTTTYLPPGSGAALAISLDGSAAINTYNGIQQQALVPSDENALPLSDLPYCLSGWSRYTDTGGPGLVQPEMRITWQDAHSVTIRDDSLPLSTVTGALNSWQRYALTVMAPANAYRALIKVYARAIGAGSHGVVIWDNIQFERCTFAKQLSLTYDPPALNPTFFSASGSGVADSFWADTASGFSYGIVATPAVGPTAQYLGITSPAVGAYGITQYSIPVDAFHTYSLYMQYQVYSALSNCQVMLVVTALDSNHVVLSTITVPYRPNEPVIGQWEGSYVTFGVYGTYPLPVLTQSVNIGFKVNCFASGASAGVVFGLWNLSVAGADYRTPNPARSAFQAGYYPTTYCGNGTTNGNITAELGIYYRQIRLFGGYLRAVKRTYRGAERKITCQATEYGCLLHEAPATFLLRQQSDYTAIQRAVSYAQNQGYLPAMDATTFVQAVGTIDSIVFTWATTRDVLSVIADMSNAAYYVDYYKRLHYASALTVSAPIALSDTPDYINTFPYENFEHEDDSTQTITVKTIEGSPQLSSPQIYQGAANGTQTTFTLNSGGPVETVDQILVNGLAQTIGLTANNTFAQGYQVLVDLQAGIATWPAPIARGATVLITFRFNAPVLVRLHATQAQAAAGYVRRKIHHHQVHPHIISQASAIRRAQADLAQFQRARPVASLQLHSPPSPHNVPLRIGQALAITHHLAGFNGTLFQIQEIATRFLGNGIITRQLKLGFYRPSLEVHVAQSRRGDAQDNTQDNTDAVLQDVLTVEDVLTAQDAAVPSARTIGIWGTSTSVSTWNGSRVWG